MIAALKTAVPDVGGASLSLLQSSQGRAEGALAPLLNELAALPNDIVLVLDDFHAIEAPAIHAGVAFLLDHLPATMHVVIATRADPPLPLASLRARGDLVAAPAGTAAGTAAGP